MLRHFSIYLILSILIVIFAKYAHFAVVYIGFLVKFIQVKLEPIFNQTGWGLVVRNILVLVGLPLILAAIPALCYRLIQGREMPHFLMLTWILWLIIVFSNILVR
ncbi:MAG: hypothetical protein H0U75_05610 [Legionella sp.]|nr:hypothetical protein [Legionella sp.]